MTHSEGENINPLTDSQVREKAEARVKSSMEDYIAGFNEALSPSALKQTGLKDDLIDETITFFDFLFRRNSLYSTDYQSARELQAKFTKLKHSEREGKDSVQGEQSNDTGDSKDYVASGNNSEASSLATLSSGSSNSVEQFLCYYCKKPIPAYAGMCVDCSEYFNKTK